MNKKNKKVEKTKQAPDIKILKITECENGDAIMEYEVNDALVDLIKQSLGKKKVSEEEINRFVLDALKTGAEECRTKNTKHN